MDIFQPNTIEEVTSYLQQYKPTKLLAGGTDLIIQLRNEETTPNYLVDLSKVPILKKIRETENEVFIGSMVTFTDLKEHESIKKYFQSFIECAKNMGSPQIRNVATIGGNIINAGAAADIIPCVISLDGKLVFESENDRRIILCEDYFNNYEKEKAKENEVLTAIMIPKMNKLNGFYKLGKRNSLAIARINTAISILVEKNKIKELSVCLGAVGRFPFSVKKLEKKAIGKKVEWLSTDKPLAILEKVVYESIRGRKSMPFKKEAIKGVYKLALQNALVEMSL